MREKRGERGMKTWTGPGCMSDTGRACDPAGAVIL